MSIKKVSVLFCLLCIFTIVHAQDMKAISKDGRTVLLKKAGLWFYIDRSEQNDTWATLRDSSIVQLNKDGTWIKTDKKGALPDQSQYAAPFPSQKGTPYKNSLYHYSMIPPKGWTVDKSAPEDRQWKLKTILPIQVFNAYNLMGVTIHQLDGGTTLRDYADKYFEGMERGGFHTERKGTGSVAGTNAQWMISTMNFSGVGYRVKTYLSVNGNLGYEIWYSARKEEFPMHLDLFEETVQSFLIE